MEREYDEYEVAIGVGVEKRPATEKRSGAGGSDEEKESADTEKRRRRARRRATRRSAEKMVKGTGVVRVRGGECDAVAKRSEQTVPGQ